MASKYVAQFLIKSMEPIESSSSGSSDEDIEWECDNILAKELKGELEPIVKIQNYVETVVSNYSDKTFKSHFRLSQRLVYDILIRRLDSSSYTQANDRGKLKVSNEKSVLITLWYLSNNETFRQISDRFNVSLSTAHSVLVRVLKFICSLCSEFIKLPVRDKAENVSTLFKEKAGIADVIGAVDGCHIRINRPLVDEEVYVNRKGYHSLLLQGIVDTRKQFINVFCGEPGSLHDARLLRKSGVYEKPQNNNLFGQRFVLGDSAYPSLHWLVPPFKDNGALTERHRVFNYRHSCTRMVVEHAFGLLKGRFRRLQHLQNLDLSVSVKCIMAACILHNIAISNNDDRIIIMVDVEDDLISDPVPFDMHSIRNSKREEVFNKMFADEGILYV